MGNFDLRRYLPHLLNRAGSRLAERFSADLQQGDLSLLMFRALSVLDSDGSMRLGTLAEATVIEVSTLSRLISSMQSRGWVTRCRSSEDARAVELSLTDSGRALVRRFYPVARFYETAALQHFTEEEKALLSRLLIKLFANLTELVPPPAVEQAEPPEVLD